ncbi:P80 family lipoprotein [Metamycoplasma hyosynoviae]|uniref:P80 family lipoprotein n=1 Tax=Metamycoplasma hyosynoviae TaxID=29559 RepID=UPI00236035C4|nr:P80 family lipoprotein [Metamycoplasma hyosynoviae]MDD1371938.1 P80 family lipoprotein [Metamycoplasma hyosynoviae]MDI3063944.1 P80 family lipoprotein [Metamycoplasma hyosynoviae]
MQTKKTLFLLTLTTPFLTTPLIAKKCENKHIEVLIPFNPEDSRYKNFETIATKYNLEQAKLPDFTQVKIITSSNRNNLYYQTSLDLTSNDPYVSDLVIHYPSLAFLINSHNRLLDFSTEISTSGIYPEFLEVNKRAFPSSTIGILPAGISTDSLIVNKITLGYILTRIQEIIDQKFPTKKLLSPLGEKTRLLEIIEHYKNASDHKKSEIDKAWNFANVLNLEALKNAKLEYSDSILLNYYDMFAFSNEIAAILNNKEQKEPKRLLYNHHIPNLLFQMQFNNAGCDYDEYFVKPRTTTSPYLNYKPIFEKGSSSYNSLKEVYDIETQASFNLALHIQKKMPLTVPPAFYDTIFSLISSHSSFEWIKQYNKLLTQKDFLYMQSPMKNKAEQTKSSFLNQGINIMGISHSPEKNKKIKKFVNWLYDTKSRQNWQLIYKTVDEDKSPKTHIVPLKNLTPIEYYAFACNYVFPSKEFISEFKSTKISELDPISYNYTQTIEAFKASPQTIKMFEEPFDNKSNILRDRIKNDLIDFFNRRSLKKPYSFEEFIKRLNEGNDF